MKTGLFFSTNILNTSEYVIIRENEKVLSRLDWKNVIIPTVTSQLSFSNQSWKAFSALSTSIPLKSGFIEDFDYLLPNDEPNLYSKHDIYVDKFYAVKFGISKVFPTKYFGFSISPGVTFEYSNCKLSGQDGFLQYPEYGYWTGAEEKKEVSATVLMYEYSFLKPQLNLDISYLSGNNGVIFAFSYFPHNIISTLDSHLIRQIQFFDKNEGGHGFEVMMNVIYNKWHYFFSFSKSFYHSGLTSATKTGVSSKEFIIEDEYLSGFKQDSICLGIGLLY